MGHFGSRGEKGVFSFMPFTESINCKGSHSRSGRTRGGREQRVLAGSKSPGSLSPLKRPGTTRVPNRPVFRVVCQANFPIRKIVFGVFFFWVYLVLQSGRPQETRIPVKGTTEHIFLLIRRSEVPTHAFGSHPVPSRLPFLRMPGRAAPQTDWAGHQRGAE